MITDITVRAKKLASLAHEGQMYGKNPYEYHLEAVASSLPKDKYDVLHICVAWLHDILEDTECTEYQLRLMFSCEIVDAVVALTKVSGETPSEYFDKVAANPIALIVKMHDTLCNLTESLKTGQMGRVRKYSAQLNKLASYK